ncbi:MAG: hypothetical protein KGH61_01405 [Candidatus Micrarchaeota archaeon]|nr:hypothetical protein [Candidatus Micrarchaeota archaeon]MDE1847587.1 hypothetical protein [Candidatus Micrarchaeota archaeon]MDE1864819.1 hypothetical protein [Candidatus Micrarchaeota archaeon]
MARTEPFNKGMLCMKIPLVARLIKSKAEIKLVLANYPNLSLVKEGKELQYLSNFDGYQFYSFKFSSESVVGEVYSTSSPVYLLKGTILRLLGILCALDGIYDFRIESIFPYIILAIGNGQSNQVVPPNHEEDLGNPDIILAKRILELLKERDKLGDESKKIKSRADLLLSHLIVSESKIGKIHEDELSLRCGLERGDLEEAIATSQSLGYKILRYARKEFRVVNV